MINSPRKQQDGISLIEVLIAVVILSFGMLALASLQAQLFRAGAEAKARAAATTFAQGRIEALRTFRSLDAGPGNYESIATGTFGGNADPDFTVGGVTYHGCIQVRRYRFDKDEGALGEFEGPSDVLDPFLVNQATGAISCTDKGDPNTGVAVSARVPEFKEITASVGWFDQNGDFKQVQLTDSIAAISPDDALELAKTPPEGTRGPVFEIDAATLNNTPGIVPIATGDKRTAASTNPTPTQFVDSLSSLTTFEVMNFVGTDNPDILKITRNIDVSAVSCVCRDDGAKKTSDTLPSYEPTVWNGKRMGYEVPQRRPDGKPVGTYIGSNSDAGITTICTVCCRDHHDSPTKRAGVDPNLRVDPYRTPALDGSHQHYGFVKQGAGYLIDIQNGLLPVGSTTSYEYIEACKVVEVDGRLRVGVDARQNDITIAAMNPTQDGYDQSNFVDRYSAFVKAYAEQAVTNRPATYPQAPTYLPAPDSTIAAAYPDVLQPPSLDYAVSTRDRKLLAYGLYIDYLSPDTLEAYSCAVAKNDSGDCKGYGTRDPLEFLPFFAINLASLGTWNSENDSIANINGATYNPQGRLATQGGLAVWGTGSSENPVRGTEKINISNSGLTTTLPVDLDDRDTALATDGIDFLKRAGDVLQPPKSLVVKVAKSSTVTLQKIGVFSPASIPCDYAPNTASSACTVPAAETETRLRLTNFTTAEKVQGITVIHDREVCRPNDSRLDSRIIGFVKVNDGTIDEYVDIVIQGMNTGDHSLVIEVLDAGNACNKSLISLTPST